jgi:hypothetical protein
MQQPKKTEEAGTGSEPGKVTVSRKSREEAKEVVAEDERATAKADGLKMHK